MTMHAVPAAAVRREAIEPTMETLAQIAKARALIRELVGLVESIESNARRSVGHLDAWHARLDEIERSGDGLMAIASEVPNGRNVAAVINQCLQVLAHDTPTGGQDSARKQLHYLFEAFGRSIFEQRFMHHVGKQRAVALRREYDQWTNTGKEQAA